VQTGSATRFGKTGQEDVSLVADQFPAVLVAALSPEAAKALFAVWLFALGGAVGSFLNVVIYRLPAGKSLVRPGSHCPACQHPIRWYDNVPILSWLLLRARCRDCGSKISFRYPLVEAITAALFVLIGVVEGLSGGENLPLEPAVGVHGAMLPPLDAFRSAAMVGYHLLLLCTLLAAALVEYDGHPTPDRLFRPALLVGWLAPLLCPSLHPGAIQLAVFNRSLAAMAGFGDATAGIVLGALLGLVFWRLLTGKRSLDLVWGPACVGLFLGWKAVLVLAVVTAMVQLLLAAAGRLWRGLRPIPPTVWLALSALAWILAWGRMVARWPVLG
jgi:leader peptidase (prepilin peptidase)/N-methyltransferase